MSQPEAIKEADKTGPIDESVTSSPIVDPTTVTSPADCGLNLSGDRHDAVSKKLRTRPSSVPRSIKTRTSVFGLLPSRKVRMLTVASLLLLVVGLIGLNAHRQPVVADSEADLVSLDLSDMGESTVAMTTLDSLDEPRRHEFDAQFTDHPLMRNAAQTRSTSETDWLTNDTHSGIVPATNFSDGPLPATASQPRRAPASGVQGAWLTGQIEPDDSPMPATILQTSSANQAAPQRLPRARHPLAD